jgi:hypothetical protein
MCKVIALGAVAIKIAAPVATFLDGPVEQVSRLFYLVTDFWQVNKTEWRAVFLDQVQQGNAVEGQRSVAQIKTFLREVIGLIN